MNKVVIGLGFGDEGKGCTVNWLASQAPSSTVIRYSGGHQAGHHVYLDEDHEHIFASFGSGTLQGCETYIHRNCVISPDAIVNEWKVLVGKGYDPKLTVHPLCPIVTPMDETYNQYDEDTRNHGTCGCGINATLERERANYHLLAGDLLYPEIFKHKLRLIEKYYYEVDPDWDPGSFLETCKNMVQHVVIGEYLSNDDNIWEGSQGLMLDKDIGFFPHCTPYNVGMKGVTCIADEAYYVTRAYSTRHGSGPMCAKEVPLFKFNDATMEINDTNEYQGRFRKSVLNVDLLEYAFRKDNSSKSLICKGTLVVTCLEHMPHYVYVYGGKVHKCSSAEQFCRNIAMELGINKFVMCREHEFSDIHDVL